jgi:hypothetical protein
MLQGQEFHAPALNNPADVFADFNRFKQTATIPWRLRATAANNAIMLDASIKEKYEKQDFLTITTHSALPPRGVEGFGYVRTHIVYWCAHSPHTHIESSIV